MSDTPVGMEVNNSKGDVCVCVCVCVCACVCVDLRLVWPHEVEPWFHSWYRGRVETLDANHI